MRAALLFRDVPAIVTGITPGIDLGGVGGVSGDAREYFICRLR